VIEFFRKENGYLTNHSCNVTMVLFNLIREIGFILSQQAGARAAAAHALE
jgi:hypothetical protein